MSTVGNRGYDQQQYSDGTSRSPRANPRDQKPKFEYTQEEKDILMSCRRDSFYQRALPLGLLNGFMCQYLIKKGKVKPGNLKIAATMFTGYIVGKMSFIPVCKARVMSRIPDSNLAKIMQGNLDPMAYNSMIMGATGVGETEEEQTPRSNTNQEIYTNNSIDTYKPSLDLDSKRPDLISQQAESNQPNKSMTYDDLRRVNRQQTPPGSQSRVQYSKPSMTWEDELNKRVQENVPGESNQESNKTDEPRFRRRKPFQEGSKNAYGDVWDK